MAAAGSPLDSPLSTIAVPYILETTAFLLGVVVIVPLFKKIKLSPIVGFLTVGAIIGPHSLAIIQDVSSVLHFAELGVIFLLFTIGLELSFSRLRAYALQIFGLGSMQVIVSSIVIGSLAYLWGNSTQASIIIGLCLSLSSTAMVIQLLNEQGEMATAHGRHSFSILLFQDLAVVPILILLPIFGAEGEHSIVSSLSIAFAKAAAAIALIIIFGRYGLRKLFRISARTQSIDVFTAMTLLTILATSLITGIAGLSMALGAFLAGLLLAETEFRHQIEGEIEPFKGLFLGLFFMSVGMNIDLQVAFSQGMWVALSVIGLIVIKAVCIMGCATLFKIPWADALRTSFWLAQGGEFAFVVIGQATLNYQIVESDVGQFMVVVAGISMMLTPLVISAGHRLTDKLSTSDSHEKLSDKDDDALHYDMHDHVVIIGFGRIGAAVATILEEEAVPYVALDNNADTVQSLREKNIPISVGDASRPEVLKRTHIDNAAALLITMNTPGDAIKTLNVARQYWPDLTIIVRARDLEHSHRLLAAGASHVVQETLEAGLQLSNYTLQAAGYGHTEAGYCIDLVRRKLQPGATGS